MTTKRWRDTLWFLGIISAPFVAPAIMYFFETDDSLPGMAFALFGPFFYVVIGLYLFWATTPRRWRESKAPEVKRIFRKYHALQGTSLFFLGLFEIAISAYLGDPWLQETKFHIVLAILYGLYAIPALLTRHFFNQLPYMLFNLL